MCTVCTVQYWVSSKLVFSSKHSLLLCLKNSLFVRQKQREVEAKHKEEEKQEREKQQTVQRDLERQLEETKEVR